MFPGSTSAYDICDCPQSPDFCTGLHLDDVLVRNTDLEKYEVDYIAYEAAEQARAKHKNTVVVAPNSLSAEDEANECIMEVHEYRLSALFV